jgi:hypothetical protein
VYEFVCVNVCIFLAKEQVVVLYVRLYSQNGIEYSRGGGMIFFLNFGIAGAASALTSLCRLSGPYTHQQGRKTGKTLYDEWYLGNLERFNHITHTHTHKTTSALVFALIHHHHHHHHSTCVCKRLD